MFACSLPPEPAHADEVDAYLTKAAANRHIPGLSVGVIRNGRLLKARGYGFANVEFAVPVTKDTVHPLASVTKIFTATAVMMLVDEGRLPLDSKAADLVLALSGAWRNVTVRHLLTHTSGVPGCMEYLLDSEGRRPPRAEVLKRLIPLPVESAPGERFAYNQTGYVILGMIIETMTGKGSPEFLCERVLAPPGWMRPYLGMPGA
jgi:CubicO group peptidase (beta-lactamase class C family)